MKSFISQISAIGFFFIITGCLVSAQSAEMTLAERLGYLETDKLLIVHADDVGMAHSVNQATFKALESGQVTSASVMVPCPWLLEVAEFAGRNPSADLGIHLTLSSEWKNFKWGPVASKTEVPTLVNPMGYFPTIREGMTKIKSSEAEVELRAQINLAKSVGIEPTHLDSHQLLLFLRPDLFQVYLKVGRESGIPILLSKQIFALIRSQMGSAVPDWESFLQPGDILIDGLLSITPEDARQGWANYYRKVIEGLKPGITELIVHLGYSGEEFKGIAEDSDFGSTWRQNEFDYLTSSEFAELLKKEKVKLITWREIGETIQKNH